MANSSTGMTLSLADVDALRRDHEDALRQWRELREQERILLIQRKWNGIKLDDDVAWTLARSEVDDAKRASATRLRDVSTLLHEANVAAANHDLASSAKRYDDAAEALVTELRGFEAAWCALVDAGWALLEAVEVERRAASSLVRHSQSAAPNDEAAERIRQSARYQVPVAVGADGPTEWADRPAIALFDGSGDAADPRSDVMWEELGRLVRAGRRRGVAHVGDYVKARLDKAAKQRQR
jgi:hypothetical protein